MPVRASALLAVMALMAGRPTLLPAERQTPIYVYFSHHIDDGRRDVTSTEPIASTPAVRWMMETYEKHGIKAQLGFVGSVLQLIDFDDPKVTAAIKRLKMPVGYHPGSGHREPCQVGRAVYVPTKGRDDLEARAKNLEILWNFETKTLIPKWRPAGDGKISDDNPQYGELMPAGELTKYNLPDSETWRYGGWMAIEKVLNISPMDTDAGGAGLLYEMLGVRSFDYNWGPLDYSKAIMLPRMAEAEIFAGRPPLKLYGKRFGEDVPRRPSPQEWLEALASSLPDDRPYVQRVFTHAAALAGPNRKYWEDLIVFLKEHPEDFQIIWPDWDAAQWEPANSAESFYRKTYSMSMAELRDAPAPIDKLMADRRPMRGIDPAPGPGASARGTLPKPQPRRTQTITMDAAELEELTGAVLGHFPQPDHDADYGGLPCYLELSGGRMVSVADAYQALARAIVHWGHEHKLPASVELPPVRGPIDYPAVDVGVEPQYDPAKTRTGYTPRETPQEKFPDPEPVWKQGLPMQSAGNHLCWPARALVEGDDVLHAAWLALKTIDGQGHIPASSPVYVIAQHSPGTGRSNSQFTKVWANAAELLPAMAQVYLSIVRHRPPMAEHIPAAYMIGTKITPDIRQMLAVPYSPMSKNGGFHVHSLKHEGFVWREALTPEQLDAAWNYLPAGP